MRLLITGAFGTVGLVTLREALARGHEVTAFVRRSRRNRRIARGLERTLDHGDEGRRLRVEWGDIRRSEDLEAAVTGQDAVIHLAAVLPPRCDLHPDLCEAVNVGGTKKLVQALEALVDDKAQTGGGTGVACPVDGPGLVYVSSVSVMGCTQHQESPLKVEDPPRPSDRYSTSKAAAEAVVKGSRLPWAILRLSAVMPTSGAYRISMVRLMFDMALKARCEVVVDLDVAHALVRAAEDMCEGGAIIGKTVFIAGGADKGCQMDIATMIGLNLAPVGLKLPSAHLFRTDVDSYYLDWYETYEGQRILGYQRHSVDDWQRLASRRLRLLRLALWPVRGLARLYLELVGRREKKRLARSAQRWDYDGSGLR